MSDLSLTPKVGLLTFINAKSSVPATEADLSQFFPPEVIVDPEPGAPNTRITLKTTMEFTHAGRVTLEYNRLNLADFSQYQMAATVEDVGTLDQYLAMLTTRYGIYFNVSDVEPDAPFDVSGGEASYTITLNAKPDSLMYYGTGQFKVNVAWRFDDPEWIEQNINRLRVLLHSELPLSILSFMNS